MMQLKIQMTFHKPKQLGYINISGYTALANKRFKTLGTQFKLIHKQNFRSILK